MGSKFGPNGSGTFGGYVELRNQKDEWKKFGLTCYHVAQPELKSESLSNIGGKTCILLALLIEHIVEMITSCLLE